MRWGQGAEAGVGACGAESLVGKRRSALVLGDDLFSVTGGKVYLTGPYKGAPFGLSIVVPVVAGPFNLGTIVTRAKIDIDPHTAQVTVVSDPLPQIIDGVPTDIRMVDAVIDRPGFMFNPTNCDAMSITGTVSGAEGASAAVSSRFQVGGCAALAFKPKFAASTQGKTSKATGASLHVKLVPPHEGPQSTGTSVGASPTSGTSGTSGNTWVLCCSNRGIKHRPRQGRPPQAAPLAADDAAEGVYG